AQTIWKRDDGAAEAVPYGPALVDTSRTPMPYGGRIYFASDRTRSSGLLVKASPAASTRAGSVAEAEAEQQSVMNIWSVKEDGTDLQQHTFHTEFDVLSPSLDASTGKIVYQNGAD